MKTFKVHLQSPARYELIEGVKSFVGLDATGSFGILVGHERMMTILAPGIMRLQGLNSVPEYLGVSGGVLYFVENQLFISTDRYLRGPEHSQLHRLLSEQMQAHAQELTELTDTIRKMEESMLKRLMRDSEARNL